MTNRLTKLASACSATALSIALMTSTTAAAQGAGPAIICPDYKQGSTQLPGQRVGKKILKAFEAYSAEQVGEAIAILKDTNPSKGFDRASVDRFLGSIMAAEEGKQAEAITYLKRAVDSNELNDKEHVETMRTLADLSLMEKNWADAIKYYNDWMTKTCKQDPDVYLRIAQAYFSNKQFNEAIAPADKAIELYPEPDKNPYALKIAVYYETKNVSELVKTGEELVRVLPDDPKWWTQLAQFYLMAEDMDRALSTFDIAYQQGYLDKASHYKVLIQLFSQKGIPVKAAKLLEKHMDDGIIERDEKLISSLANSYRQALELRKAAKYYGEAAELSDDPITYIAKQGEVLLMAERYSEAVSALKKALELNPAERELGKIKLALMESLFYQGKYKDAYAYAQEAAKIPSSRRNARSWASYIKEKAKVNGVTL